MKKILALAAVAALGAGVSAYAANPFSDVSTSDWAYQAVSDLSDQGIVEGYPDGTFKGQTNITRYELAQVIARLMAKEDQYNAEQRRVIDKLAGEYADELDSLGVRVSNLEKKVGNISWSGDARMRWQGGEGDHGDLFRGRIRINMKAAVNDNVTVIGRFKSETDLDGKTDKDGSTEMDRIHVLYKKDALSVDLGRTDLWLGQTGYLYDDTFDGVKVGYDAGKVALEAGYGREYKAKDAAGKIGAKTIKSAEVFYVKANAKLTDAIGMNAFYEKFAKAEKVDDDIALYGVGASAKLGGGFTVEGDYIWADSKTYDDPTMWVAGLTYGKMDVKKPGSYKIGVHYTDVEKGAFVGSTTLDMDDMIANKNGAKFWNADVHVALMKGVELAGYYYFAGEDQDGNDLDDCYGIDLKYKF